MNTSNAYFSSLDIKRAEQLRRDPALWENSFQFCRGPVRPAKKIELVVVQQT